MGGFSSSSIPSAAPAQPSLIQALSYSFAAHKNAAEQGRAGRVRLSSDVMSGLIATDIPATARAVAAAVAPAPRAVPSVALPPVAVPGPKPGPGSPAAPPSPAPVDPRAEAASRRQQQAEREARGRVGLVGTSWRGVLASAAGGRKTLLGE